MKNLVMGDDDIPRKHTTTLVLLVVATTLVVGSMFVLNHVNQCASLENLLVYGEVAEDTAGHCPNFHGALVLATNFCLDDNSDGICNKEDSHFRVVHRCIEIPTAISWCGTVTCPGKQRVAVTL